MTGNSSPRSRNFAGPLIGALVAFVLLGMVLTDCRAGGSVAPAPEHRDRFSPPCPGDLGGLSGSARPAPAVVARSGDFGFIRATLVAAASQAAALFAPVRSGELVMPWLLARTTGRDLSSGVGILLAARVLDLASLGVWCGLAVLVVWGLTEPFALVLSVLLLAPCILLPVTLRSLIGRPSALAPRGMAGRRWARRVRRVRRELERLVKTPRTARGRRHFRPL